MINNSNYAHWDRLEAKTLDTQFTNEMINGLNCSPFEAEAILEKVDQIYAPLWEGNTAPKLGQIQMVVVRRLHAPQCPFGESQAEAGDSYPAGRSRRSGTAQKQFRAQTPTKAPLPHV